MLNSPYSSFMSANTRSRLLDRTLALSFILLSANHAIKPCHFTPIGTPLSPPLLHNLHTTKTHTTTTPQASLQRPQTLDFCHTRLAHFTTVHSLTTPRLADTLASGEPTPHGHRHTNKHTHRQTYGHKKKTSMFFNIKV